MSLNYNKILITGASDGIGKAIALSLAKEGISIIILGRNEERLQGVVGECNQLGAESVEYFAFDLSDRSSMTDHLEQIRSEHSDIDCIVNNAGIWQKLGDLDQFSHDQIEEVIATNLTATIKVTNTLLPVLRKQDKAAIINISSKSGIVAQQGQSIYTASKYGVRGFTDVLKVDLKGSSIRVAGVYQSGTNTGMFAKTGEDFPIEKFTEPEDLANVIVFMLSQPDKIWMNEVHVNY